MKTQLLFLACALISVQLHAMELVLSTNDLLNNITQHIINNHPSINLFNKYTQLDPVRKTFATLSLTAKCLCAYYADEKVQQTIIRTVADANKMSDQNVASVLNCKIIHSKINFLQKVIEDNNKREFDLSC
jgi:hypothetical protein